MKPKLTNPLALLAGLLLWSAALPAETVTTSLQVPLAGTVFVELAGGSLDEVALTGYVHVVTQYLQPDGPPIQPQDPMRIKINLDSVSGTVRSPAGATRPLAPTASILPPYPRTP
jgi:hypothetical protein